MRSRIVLGICITLLLAGSLSAASIRWNGSVSELWSNPDNWNGNVIPGADDKAQIVDGGLAVIDYDAGIVRNFVLEAGGSTLRLVDGAQLTAWEWTILAYVGGAEDARHTLEVLGGVYNGGDVSRAGNNGRIYVGREGFGRLVIDNSGVVNLITQEMAVGQGANGDGVVELRGGTLNLTDNGDWPLRFATGTNAKGHMDISGGVIKQRFSDGRLTRINGYIADGSITAYGGVGTVIVETTENNVLVVKGLHPLNPVPQDGGTAVPGNITLSWTAPDPCTPGAAVAFDVYLTDNLQAIEQFLDPAAIRVVNKQAVTSVLVQTQPKKRYYWAIDSYVGSATDPVFGPIFSFIVDNIPPRVNAGANIVTWLQDGSKMGNLDATVTDEDAYTVKWTVVSEPNGAPAAVIQAATAEDTTVTLSATGRYVLQLDASDGEYTGSDTVTIDVYTDSCEAAQSVPGYQPLVGDLNGDCRVDDTDLALLQENWLKDNSLSQDWFLLP